MKEQNCSVFCLEITTVLTSIHKAFNKGSLTEKMGPFSQQDVKILRLRRSMPPTENGRVVSPLDDVLYHQHERSLRECS